MTCAEDFYLVNWTYFRMSTYSLGLHSALCGSPFMHFSFSHLLWIGDLNYRLDCPNDEVRKRIAAKDWEYLFGFDQVCKQTESRSRRLCSLLLQLQLQMKKAAAFECFTEGEIKFAPTYKYDTNSDIYDTSEKGTPPLLMFKLSLKLLFLHREDAIVVRQSTMERETDQTVELQQTRAHVIRSPSCVVSDGASGK